MLRQDAYMTSSLNQVQAAELDLLKWFKTYCENNHLVYYISGGTLLGAVRHHGFIPWDDDIDVALPRKDYERLVKEVRDNLPSNMFASHYSWDDNTVALCLRLHSNDAHVVSALYNPPQVQPCWIDIFPLDAAPGTPLKTLRAKLSLSLHTLQVILSKKDRIATEKKRPLLERTVLYIIDRCHIKSRLTFAEACSRLDHLLIKNHWSTPGFVFNYHGRYKFLSVMNYSQIYGVGTFLPFEDEQFFAPEDYDSYLKQIYGDYMTPPAPDQRNDHGTTVLQT